MFVRLEKLHVQLDPLAARDADRASSCLIKIMECPFVKNVTVENIVMVQLFNAMTAQLVAIIIVITLAAPHAPLESGPIQ
jgi:hypothetical protein